MYELYAVKRRGGGWTRQHWFELVEFAPNQVLDKGSLCTQFIDPLSAPDATFKKIHDEMGGTQRSHKTDTCKRCETLQASSEGQFVNRLAEQKARRAAATPDYAKPRPQKNKVSKK